MILNLKKRIITSIILFSILFLMFINIYITCFFLLILGAISLIEFFGMIQIIYKKEILKKIFINLLFIIFIFLFCSYFFIFSLYFHLKILLYLILLTCVASDIGGFAIGKIVKGPKLIKISPNKTISGSLGSFIFSVLLFSLSIHYITGGFNIKIILVGILTSLGCQVGDLCFSFIKRKSSLKDTGNFLPGHGGVLDRIDGVLFGLPIGFLILVLIY